MIYDLGTACPRRPANTRQCQACGWRCDGTCSDRGVAPARVLVSSEPLSENLLEGGAVCYAQLQLAIALFLS